MNNNYRLKCAIDHDENNHAIYWYSLELQSNTTGAWHFILVDYTILGIVRQLNTRNLDWHTIPITIIFL